MANKDNPKKGALFEAMVAKYLGNQGICVQKCFPVTVGINTVKRLRKFDLGSESPKLVIECKSHKWTEGGHAPSAKMTSWNEAMYYFSITPSDYRKMFFVSLDRFKTDGKKLSTYYIQRFEHLIPCGVEIWEFDIVQQSANCVYPRT